MADELRIGVVALVHNHVWEALTEPKEKRNTAVICAPYSDKPLLTRVKVGSC